MKGSNMTKAKFYQYITYGIEQGAFRMIHHRKSTIDRVYTVQPGDSGTPNNAHFSSACENSCLCAMAGGNNDCKVYVGNLPADIRARDLEDIFYKYGKIVDVDLHDRRGPPFAFVEFEDAR